MKKDKFCCDTAECWFGTILVASSPQGLVAVEFGEFANAMVNDFWKRFPHALKCERPNCCDWAQKAAAVIETVPGKYHTLPVDLRGTSFQKKVWRALRATSVGTTISYTDLARRIGLPKAARAVASACAANPIAVLVPCHRAIRADGDIGRYKWGRVRKRMLLAKEGATF